MRFRKYQALGNDYIVLERADLRGADSGRADPQDLRPALRRRLRRHPRRGRAPDGGLALRIFNPDGSEAEKSGNGLRIFARYLWDEGRVGDEPFAVATKGGAVRCQVRDGGRMVFVEMGAARFDSELIPVAGPPREVVGEPMDAGGEHLRFTGVTVGNPHCVVHVDEPTPELARRLGPVLETHALFPKRTNVQFVRVLGRHRIAIEIWERGAGYTLASGSSSCAAAAASVRLGLCSGDVTVDMPGGSLEIGVGDDYALTMLGPVGRVADGAIADELVRDAG